MSAPTEGTPTDAPVADPAPTPAPTPAPAPTPEPAPAPEPRRGNDDLRAQIAALPEQIVNAIREGMPAPTPTPTPAPTDPKETGSPSGATGREPSKLAKWFFG